jgi:hypothetical protein
MARLGLARGTSKDPENANAIKNAANHQVERIVHPAKQTKVTK